MQRLPILVTVLALALSVAASVGASADPHADTVSVRVQHRLNVRENVHISFQPTAPLAPGGYYYAVIVLNPYRQYTEKRPPSCATSSNMERADYGYPHPGHLLQLTLIPAKSSTGHWCSKGIYTGGIYAVPHAPPCNSTYPCRSEPDERSPCFELEDGHRACGVVAQPRLYRYPNALPRPLASGTRIVGHFTVSFNR